MYRTHVTIPVELLACLAEINSDLGYMLDCGFDGDVLESIAALQMRTTSLIEQMDTAIECDRERAQN